MTTYRPFGIKELQDLLQRAKDQNLPVLTRHQRQEGIGIDFQNWNQIREIDELNLTVTAERAVTLGELEDAVREKGLHMAAMTEDLRMMTLGDFFAEQMFCLTSLFYNQPRFQILGLEVMLADGTVLQVAGKTVKNVTGYDMCRFYISNRETLAIPLAFTIKLVSRKPAQVMLEADIADAVVLPPMVRALRQFHILPQVCVYWNAMASEQLQCGKKGRLILVCNGDEETVKRELESISRIAQELHIGLQLCEAPEQNWALLRILRSRTIWQDGIKVPSLQCESMLELLAETQTGCWYNPLQGSMQLISQAEDVKLYSRLCEKAVQLGGCGNTWYQMRYGIAPAGELAVWNSLKQQFDAQNRLNPVQEGSV